MEYRRINGLLINSMQKAILTNLLTGEKIKVHATTDHPDSSYNQPVWVDKDNNCYGQVDMPILGYKIEEE